MCLQYDFCVLPSTLGEDGDPLDVLVQGESSVVPGCVVRARLIGVIEATQKDDKDEGTIRNDRLGPGATPARGPGGTRWPPTPGATRKPGRSAICGRISSSTSRPFSCNTISCSTANPNRFGMEPH